MLSVFCISVKCVCLSLFWWEIEVLGVVSNDMNFENLK